MSFWDDLGDAFSTVSSGLSTAVSYVGNAMIIAGKEVYEDIAVAVDKILDKETSKGVSYHTFIDKESGASIAVTGRGTPVEMYHSGSSDSHLEMDSESLSFFEKSGRFNMQALDKNGVSISTGKWVEIIPVTGGLNGGNMDNMSDTPSFISDDYTVCYGFYDAQPGESDTAYMYVTKSQKEWMKAVIQKNNAGSLPFTCFVLPGAHDAGMTGLDGIDKNISLLAEGTVATGPTPLALLASLGTAEAKRWMVNFAITQKDTITHMLEIGIRYFDFRPGYFVETGDASLVGVLHHQHNFIAGVSYKSFLNDIRQFLLAHTGEIVVVRLANDGFFNHSLMDPSAEKLTSLYEEVFPPGDQAFVKGTKADITHSYDTIISEKKRLIFLNGDFNLDLASKYDVYNGDAHETTDVNKIIRELNSMTREGQANADITIFQLQGTANGETGWEGGIMSGMMTVSDASSPLLGTKSGFDSVTYPWILNNIAQKFDPAKLVAVLNDFSDNQLVNCCSTITEDRIKQIQAAKEARIVELRKQCKCDVGVVFESAIHPGMYLCVDDNLDWGFGTQVSLKKITTAAEAKNAIFKKVPSPNPITPSGVMFESLKFPNAYLVYGVGQGSDQFFIKLLPYNVPHDFQPSMKAGMHATFMIEDGVYKGPSTYQSLRCYFFGNTNPSYIHVGPDNKVNVDFPDNGDDTKKNMLFYVSTKSIFCCCDEQM